jgi:predicted metalloprotease with PDZ domain
LKHRRAWIWMLVAALGLPAYAGTTTYKKCTASTQSCLDYMAAKLKNKGWLGIEYDQEPAEVKITRVVPGSPAEAAGFAVGDVLVSVNGVKFASNTEDRCMTCEATQDRWKPGARVDYVVLRRGKELRLTPTLAALPPDIMAQIIGMHMLEHASADPK